MTFNTKLMVMLMTLLGFLVAAEKASAHATSIGFENAGPGAVNVWLGTYPHGGHHLEGSMQLQGVNGTVFGPVATPFNMLTPDGFANKPAGLVDGVTNFFPQGPCCNNALPLVGSFTLAANLLPNHWQGVTFAGLTPGDYQFTYIPIANPSAEWSLWSANMNGIFTLSGDVLGCGQPGAPACPEGTPTPATLPLLALGLISAGAFLRRRKR